MDKKEAQNLAKTLLYVLGRRPDEFGLVPDEEGFVTIKELLQALREEPRWRYLNYSHIQELLHWGYRGELEIVGQRIRAVTPQVSFVPEPTEGLPPRLYCGIRRKAWEFVMHRGLVPPQGKWLVLARSPELALRMAKRKGQDPLLVEVRVQEALARGVRFYSFQGEIFLSEGLGPEFLIFPEGPPKELKRKEPPKGSKMPEKGLPGSFIVKPKTLFRPEGKGKEREDKSALWRKDRKRRARR